MSEELKSCPFCGSSDIGGVRHKIYCYSCKVNVSFDFDFDEPLQLSTDAWNTRSKTDEIEKLQAINKEQRIANAKLISAAPDMYEALEVILNTTEAGHRLSSSDLRMAKKALKKARGES